MIVYLVKISIKPGFEKAFIEATKLNSEGSHKEKGVVQFDLSQSSEESTEFIIYEVYSSEEAVKDHKKTEHYLKWRDTVEPMMKNPRVGTKFSPVFE